MRDLSWIIHSTLTKHQAGTSVQDWWPVWPVKHSKDPLKREKMLSHLPAATWILASLPLKPKCLWSLVNWEDQLQHMIRSFPILPPFFTLTW